MKEFLDKHVFSHFYSMILIGVTLVIASANYIPGTFLIGWDNLYSELNFEAAFKMNLFSVWQEYRGLGVQDVLSHGANIIQTCIVYLLSYILPTPAIRYTYHFLCLFMGTMGMYVLLSRAFHKKKIFAFTGALFYQLNLVTIQMFYAPLEVFSTHFAALPWLAYGILRFFHYPTKKSLFIFFIISLLATPQGFVPTVFIAYCSLVASLIGVEILREKKAGIKKGIAIVCVIAITNSFWLLPFIHAAVKQGPIVKETKINQHSSELIYEKNKEFGDLSDVLLLRGFMLKIIENNSQSTSEYIMKPWRAHIFQPAVYMLSLVLMSLFLLGGIACFYRYRKHKTILYDFYFLPAMLIGIFMLGTEIPVLSTINGLLRQILPLFGEAFRFPFTKFSLVFILTYTIFLTEGIQFISRKFSEWHTVQRWPDFLKTYVPVFLVVIVIIAQSFPAFQGHLFFNLLRLSIPKEYFSTIEYFKKQPVDRRVMTLPQTSFWNWLYYDWHARGSGFLWYGIEQPTMERPFDPWSNYNEQYLNELLYAIENEDVELLKNIITKYDISYILLDENMVNRSRIQREGKFDELLAKATTIEEKQRYGMITIYKLPARPFVSAMPFTVKVGSTFAYESIDENYRSTGNYEYSPSNWNVSYLFPALFTNKTFADREVDISVQEDSLEFIPRTSIQPSNGVQQYILEADPFIKYEQFVPITLTTNSNKLTIAPPVIRLLIDGKVTTITLFKEQEFLIDGNLLSVQLNGQELPVRNNKATGLAYSQVNNSVFIQTSTNTASGVITFPDLEEPFQQLISLTTPSKVVLSYEKIQPPEWSSVNILDKKNYTIEAPCLNEIRNGKSLFKEFKDGALEIKSQGSSTCFHQYLSGIPQNTGTVITLNVTSDGGKPFTFVVDNPSKKINFVDTLLNDTDPVKTIIVPPTSNLLSTDYGTHLLSESDGNTATEHRIYGMQVAQFPYGWLKSLRIRPASVSAPKLVSRSGSSLSYSHPFKHMYVAPVTNFSGTIHLSQAYNDSWKAYIIPGTWHNLSLPTMLPSLFGIELQGHTKINNWANGWNIAQPVTGTIVMIFWPQYFQFAGYGILILGTLILIFSPIKKLQKTWTDLQS